MFTDKLITLSENANEAFREGNFEKALALYNEAIRLHPTNSLLYSNRSAIFLRLKCFRESFNDAEKSLALNPKFAKGYFRKGHALLGIGQFDKAILAYCQSLAIECRMETFHALNDGLRYSSIKDHLPALLDEITNDTNDAKLDSFLIISLIGQEYLASGHVIEAISLLQLALGMNEAKVAQLDLRLSVLGAISFAYYQQKNHCEAIEYLRMQLEINEQHGDIERQMTIYSSIVRIALLDDRTTMAINYLQKQIQLMHSCDMETNDSLLKLADLYIQLGYFQHSTQIIASLRPLTFQSILESVKIALAENDTKRALTYCKKLAKVSNGMDEKVLATILKCRCLLLGREATTALSILQSAMTNLDNSGTALESSGQFFGILSECHLALGQYSMARKWAKKELEVAKSLESLRLEADALRNLSNIYQAIGDYSNAVTLWNKYCQLISGQGVDIRLNGWRKLAQLCQKLGQFDRAEMALLENVKVAEKTEASTLLIDVYNDMYQFYRIMHRKDEAEKYWHQAREVYLKDKVKEREALMFEMIGDNHFDCNSYDEAIDAYNDSLMIAQEDGNIEKEAQLCNKLGTTHCLLYRSEKALAYYHQSLIVYQQLSDLESILELHIAMANVHFKNGMMDECHSNLRCALTLATILSKDAVRLNAFVSIGRTLLFRKRYLEARKIFVEAMNMTSETSYRRERGLLYGYIAECYLGTGEKSKALHNFCKQIPFFDDIDDIDGKCETLRHLIEEKQLIKDSDWTMRLCNTRINLSHSGSIDLQVQVLRESAETAANLSKSYEACKFLEKALILCIANKCGNILNLLLILKSNYLKCNSRRRAIVLFRECLDTVRRYSNEQLLIQLELGKLELDEGLISDVIAHIMNVRENCQDKDLRATCEYILACAYYDGRNYNDALYHMQNFENLKRNLSTNQKKRLKLELLLIEWNCTSSDQVMKDIQDVVAKAKSLSIHRILDESCLYDLLNYEKLSKISAVHWLMTRGDFIAAKNSFNLYTKIYRNCAEYTADLALFYWNEQKFKKCVNLLENFLENYFPEVTTEEDCDEFSLIRIYNRQRVISDFLYAILILCKCMLNADTVETVTIAEMKFWRNCQNRKPFFKYSIPTIQIVREFIQNLTKSLLYCLHLDQYKFLWYFKVGQAGKLQYFLDNNATKKMPIFFAQFLDQIFHSIDIIPALNYEEFEKLVSESEFLVNVQHWDIRKTHLIALLEPKQSKNRKEPEIGIFYAGMDSEIISLEHIRPTDNTDFIYKMQVSSLAIVDTTQMSLAVIDGQSSFFNNDIVILLNNDIDDAIVSLRIGGSRCLLDIKEQTVHTLMPFIDKLINGHSIDECSELLQTINVRLFGDRSSTVRCSRAQCTRKMIIDAADGLIKNSEVSEIDQREIDNFKGLPRSVQLHLLNIMKEPVKTNEIESFVEKLNDLIDCEIDDDLKNCTTDGDLRHLFAETTHDEQNSTLEFIKHLFRDHLYGIYDEVETSKLDDPEELMKSLANNVRMIKKKQQRKGSRRSSPSQNSVSQSVLVDVEFHEPQ